ncbi:ferric reductase-like transmembrane domain-containing protein [Niallia sp. NCCP-28]|uniref:ferric reductase-like transmembrane domain-containing protein n=1 Tax=Niallia sp. NCCP-28 TaxID=2934712 RepID=UPI00207EF5EA|nr:ferric reductase-like transmembrane domain-containing protein [Niallia sp. NCCP-28]GKU83657.1 hypothetical protein NCCP28_30530 [Niallia sp. NCCP-28]
MLDELSTFFSVWNVTRGAAITAYLLLFISMVTGISYKLPLIPKRYNQAVLTTHEATGWFALLFGMVHGIVLLFEKEYTTYTLINILVPFTVKHNAFSLCLGIFAFYGLLLLILSTDFIKKLGKKAWKTIHFLAFPAFYSSLFHGIFIGSDSESPIMLSLYIFTGVTVLFLTILRILHEWNRRKKTQPVNMNI